MNGLERVDLLNPVNWSHPLNDRRVLWLYGLPQISGGGRWFDLCRGNHGALVGSSTSWIASDRGIGIQRDSFVNGYAEVSDSAPYLFTGTAPFTVSVTFKPVVLTNTFARLLGTENANNVGWYIAADNSTPRKMYLYRANGLLYSPQGALTIGAWTRFTFVYSGTQQSMYQDGRQVLAPTNDSGSISGGTVLRIGQSPRSSTSFNEVQIANVSVWNRALSPAEAVADYEQDLRGQPDTLTRLRRKVYYVDAGVSPTPASAALVFDWW